MKQLQSIMIKQVDVRFRITKENGEVTKHYWKITGFLHRKLRIDVGGELKITTATKIRDWFMNVLQGVE